jgi:Flp pilus assembly protein CpaB
MRSFSWRRKLPTSSKAFLALALACGLGAYGLVQHQTQRAAQLELAVGPLVPVVVAARDLVPGQTLAPSDLDVARMPGAFVPPSAVSTPDDAIGLVTGAPVVRGEPLSSARLAAEGGPLPETLAPGRVAVTIELPWLPQGLTPGDRVDVLATYGRGRSITSALADDVRVLQVPSAQGGTFGGTQSPWLTLELDPDRARDVVNATAYARLTVLVRAAEPIAATPSPSPTVAATATSSSAATATASPSS